MEWTRQIGFRGLAGCEMGTEVYAVTCMNCMAYPTKKSWEVMGVLMV